MPNKSGITPLGDRCIVEVMPEQNKIGSIFIPDKAVEAQTAAKADAILLESGDLVREQAPYWPKDGANVLILKYAGVRYQPTPDDPDYRIVNWEDIVGVKDQ
jgi:co-chaperonin GroES (HSP10)